MGQHLSTRAQPDKKSSRSKSRHSQRSRRQDPGVEVGRKSTKSVHRDRATAQGDNSFGGRPHLNALRDVTGNTGTGRRSKSGKAQLSTASIANNGIRQRSRKSDIEQTKARAKAHQHTKSHASSSASHQRNRNQSKACVICTDVRSLHRFPEQLPTEQCTHGSDACRRCLRTWIQSEFSTKIWNEINCPICATRMQYDDIRAFAPRGVFRRYDKLTTKAMYDAIPNYRWCITKNCKSGQVHQPGTFKFRCKSCKKSHCVQHNVPWHKGETCQEYDYRTNKNIKRDEEAASRKVLLETTKGCPGCKRNIEKSFGCDHMTCSKCRHEFCWQCLASYAKKGGRRVIHREGCVYYDPNGDSE